ncbi:hypothetical protein PTKIN_Ptkin09bG0047300 [Pterospermum kingtungense]
MESQHFGHSHPLVFNESDQSNPNPIQESNCARCGEVMSDPSFRCAECEFYLHKKCAEAPSRIHHPFHRTDHPLVLLQKPPYSASCNFWDQKCELFLYHCSCNLDFHIKCALFSLDIAENRLGDLSIKDPLTSTENGKKEVENSKCFGCWEPLLGSPYFSLDCGFNLHKKCSELPHEINHPFHKNHPLLLQFDEGLSCKICFKDPSEKGFVYFCSPCKFALHIECAQLQLRPQLNLRCHRKHPLVLQFNSENLPCKACQETQYDKLVYCCSSCKFALHIECASPPLTIKEKCHQHPFTLFWKQVSFICNACGLEGNSVAFMCSTCNLLVHKNCISLPPIIRVPRHHHPIFHNYFLQETEFKSWDCSFCDTQVDTEYGSYYCSDCNFIAHVKCATEREGWYYVVEADEKLDVDDDDSVSPITEKNGGEMTKIKHEDHKSVVSLVKLWFHDDENGLLALFVDEDHKSVVSLVKLWFHDDENGLLALFVDVDHLDRTTLYCGFAYKCNACNDHICLRCGVRDYRITHQAHRHPLFFNRNYDGQCNGCGIKMLGLFRCKLCNFNLGIHCCLKLPRTARHKCDEHPLELTYQESNDYSKHHYCDICEEKRDPKFWFYHCATCETCADPGCVLGRYPFMKPGSIYKEKDHPHPLTFVRKAYYYPAACHKCCEPCQDLALECPESTCNYIVHWECVKPPSFRSRRPIALYKTQADAVADDS